MGILDVEIAVYNGMRASLEEEHKGEWVLVHGQTVQLYEDFQEAAHHAVKQFGSGPFLIRQVGDKPLRIPGHMLYRSN